MFYKVLYTSMHTYFESGKHWPQHGAFGQTGIDPSQGFPMEKWTVLDAAQRHSKLQRDFTNCNAMASLPNIAGLIKIDSYDLVCTSYVMSWLETNSSNSACVCMCNCHPRCDSQIMDMDAWFDRRLQIIPFTDWSRSMCMISLIPHVKCRGIYSRFVCPEVSSCSCASKVEASGSIEVRT